jgi:hypothetical protein
VDSDLNGASIYRVKNGMTGSGVDRWQQARDTLANQPQTLVDRCALSDAMLYF